MSREWQSGEVALLSTPTGRVRGMCIAPGKVGMNQAERAIARWVTQEGVTIWRSVRVARPLAVIDPDDTEQVQLLDDLHWETNDETTAQNNLRQALLDYADGKKPKPPEPPGLGAVVEDAEGRFWTRKGFTDTNEDWTATVGEAYTSRPYSRISAVKVKSMGLHPDHCKSL